MATEFVLFDKLYQVWFAGHRFPSTGVERHAKRYSSMTEAELDLIRFGLDTDYSVVPVEGK